MRPTFALGRLVWMVVAQLCFAAMNVFTRLGSRDLAAEHPRHPA